VDSWQDVTGALVGGLALSLIQRRSTSSGHNWKRLVSHGDRLTLAGFRENNEVMEIAMTELVKTVSALQYRLAAEWVRAIQSAAGLPSSDEVLRRIADLHTAFLAVSSELESHEPRLGYGNLDWHCLCPSHATTARYPTGRPTQRPGRSFGVVV
jgi:hypothetical protein